MNCIIDKLPDLGIIRVKLTNEITLEDRSAALDKVLAQQAESAYRNVLVDLSDAVLVEASISSEAIAHASRLARDPVVRTMWIAYVGDPTPGVGIESLAALRGYFYQRFRTQSSAIRWLSGEGMFRHCK
jgi:hypothetical protein